jgi:uncharacterized protein YggU (UPF0235/DUF167 family)
VFRRLNQSTYLQLQANSITASNDCLQVAVQAPPRDGEANVAIAESLADKLGVRKHDVTLAIGGKSKDKVFRVQGLDSSMAALILAQTGSKK